MRFLTLLSSLFSLVACQEGPMGPLAYTGTIEVTEVDVAAMVPGRLTDVAARQGEKVQAGQVLIKVDVGALEAQKDAMSASVQMAKAAVGTVRAQQGAAAAQVDVLRRETSRVEKLVGAGGATDQQLSKLRGQLAVASAQYGAATEGISQAEAAVLQAEAAVRALEEQLSQATVESPVSGVVLSRNREPGEVVSAGMSVLTLGDLEHPRLRVYVPLAEVETIQLGAPVTVRLDANPEKSYPGKVSWIASEAEFTPRDILTPKERVKQVFAVDIALTPDVGLHPGVPADAVFGE